MNLFWEYVNSFSNFIYDTLSSRASISLCTTSSKVIDFSWHPCVLHKSCDTQKSMDCKQTKKNIGDLYVNIKSRADN
jgi:hypothetical protein